jgi:hypothetical protein
MKIINNEEFQWPRDLPSGMQQQHVRSVGHSPINKTETNVSLQKFFKIKLLFSLQKFAECSFVL